MTLLNQLTDGVGRAFVFDRLRPNLRSYFLKAGITEVPYKLFGVLFWLSITPVAYIFIFYAWDYILSLGKGSLVEFALALIVWLAIHSALVAAIILLLYTYLYLRIFKPTQKK